MKKCEPCIVRNKSVKSTTFCNDCEEYLCDSCTIEHRSHKQNQNHTITINEALHCDPCLVNGKTETAVKFCLDCEEPEPVCASCADKHLTMKRTRGHRLSSDTVYLNRLKQEAHKGPRKTEVSQLTVKKNAHIMNENSPYLSVETQPMLTNKKCEPCHHRDQEIPASHYCQDCDERYCEKCMQKHSKSKQTKDHNVVDISPGTSNCKLCMLDNVFINAKHFCEDCDGNLCDECKNIHISQKNMQKHKIRPLPSVAPLCEICESEAATLYCEDCEDSDLLCEVCAEDHKSLKQNRTHKLSNDLGKFISNSKQRELAEKTELRNTSYKFDNSRVENIREEPEKPYVTEEKSVSDHINLKWEHKKKLSAEESYQIYFKELSQGKWKIFSPPKPCHDQMVVVDGLKAETSYVFKVRVADENTGTEGPFSPESDIIKTGVSPALQIMKKSKQGAIGPPNVYIVPITENKAARNETAQTRKFTLGSPGSNTQEKTVMIVGATGSGKSTLINNMANYVLGVTWEDPFRFSLINLETCEEIRKGDEALSQTEWITCYTIYNDVSSRINYTINLIDTPGFGDTRGLTQDAKIVSQIRQLFTAKGEKGVTMLDAVCFILKAPDARLTTTQKYIFESVLALFGKDIVDNICTLVTFADGQKPPVLAGLEALSGKPLPYEVYFPFNNSALFVNNAVDDQASLSQFFWDMGMKSCGNFFQNILCLQTKSLLLTSEVLTKRQKLENTILHLQQDIDKGLTKVNSLEQEIAIFTKFKRQINENKNFKYTVDESIVTTVDISGKGIYTTTCVVCNNTCHANCRYANDSDKAKCCAISNGSCTICPKKCTWNLHSNLPFVYERKTIRVTKTYFEMLSVYQEASTKKLTQKQLIEKMNDDIMTLECGIQIMIEEITEYTNRLKDIALRPDPLSTVQYIELLIESENLEKKSGYQHRMQTLEECKKRAQYGKSVQIFADRLQTTRSNIEQTGPQEGPWILQVAKQKFNKLFS